MSDDDKALIERLRYDCELALQLGDDACVVLGAADVRTIVDRIEALSAENERLRLHLDVALETLAEEGVCGDECITCKEARAALGEQQ